MSIIQNMMLAFQQLIGSKKSITEQIEEAKSSALNNIKTIFSSAEHKLADERVQIGNDAKAFFRIRSQQPLFSNPLAWQSYQPITEINKNTFPDRILVGYWTDYNSICVNKEPEIVVPAYLPFFQNQRAIIIDVNNATEDAGLSLMKAIIERIYTIIPHYTKFTLIDPQTHGAAFPMKRDLETRQQDTDIYHLLDAIIADAEQITTSAALTKDDYFSSRLETITMNEKFEIICAANFPNRSGYDARTIDRLVSIGNIGYVSGKYLVIVNNQDKRDELPRDFNINKFEGAIHIDLTRRNTYIGDYAGLDDNASLVFLPEEECPASTWKEITDKIRKDFEPKERPITWEDHIDIPEEKIWRESSKEIIETPIGDANGKSLSIWFGKKGDILCSHGMLAATTGAGKSNFYHALILGLAKRYSPKELRMYLIDGKNGVEFDVYKSLPHAEVVSLKSSSELAGSILKELVEEKKRRNTIFVNEGANNNYENYIKDPDHEMPRILLLIDEYQVLFEGENAIEASENLQTLVSQGRSAGIHLLLGSQHYGTPNMMNKDNIFSNIQLFIAMKMTMDDRLSLTQFGREGKDLIRKCERTGQIVVNQNGGGDGFNKLGKVALVEKEKKEKIIAELREKAVSEQYDDQIMRTIIFEGDSAPDMDKNPQLISCLEKPVLTPEALQKKARIPESEDGFGKTDWILGEKPIICWMGQEMNVYGQFSAVIRRRQMENMLILGDNNPYRYGMLVSSIISIVATNAPSDVEFHIYDRSIVGADWNPYLRKIANEILFKAGYTVHFANKVMDIKTDLQDVVSKLKERRDAGQDNRQNQKTIIIIFTEPEDIEDLNLVTDKMGFKMDSEIGKELEFIYSNGTLSGVHLIMSSSGVMPLQNVIQKKQLQYFRHRVTLQISEQDSFDLLGTRDGSRLQMQGEIPVMALYKNNNGGSIVKFKPYSVTDNKFDLQFNHLKELILKREYGRVISSNGQG